ncbi:putative Major facilitator superfamily transporter [Seiridium unicorne]|uniref:Major facilitator superfamily transporter n=1 Tax=Seiridium unicorne TaxID=138068 RepID=A0ABR2UHS3_9PEZI
MSDETVKSPRVDAASSTTSPTRGLDKESEGAVTDETSTKKKHGFWRTVQRYVWDDPDKPEYEKKFLFKLDLFLLTYTCLGMISGPDSYLWRAQYFCKNLDQQNISNAYVSGMKEALGMYGSELTYASNVFTAGYVISQLPAVILVTKLRPSYVIPTLEVLWSVFTFCSAAVKTVPQLYAMRFLVGLCEGAFFPCIIYLIASWYTKSERGKRTTIFYSTATLAGMFSGYLQAGAYSGLNGKLGHAGWQWLFIVCGIISLPVGIIGYFFNPDFPENTRAFYLTKEEVAFARQRLLDDGYKPLGASAWNKTKIFKIFATWQFWVLSLGYFFVQSSYPSQQPFYALYLKAEGHSTYQVNVWPTGQAAIGAVTQILAGMLSDSPLLKGRRWQAIAVMQSGTIFSTIVLAIWDVPVGLRYVAFYMSYMSAGVPGIYYSWFPDLMPDDHEMRGFMTAFSNCFSYVNQIWFSLAVWRTAEGPRFRAGFIAAATFGVVLVLTALLMRYMESRDTRKRETERVDANPTDAIIPAGAVDRTVV